MRQLFTAFCFAALLAGAPPAQARGDLRNLERSCVLKAGPDLIYLSTYLPNASHRKFCGDIPLTGPAIFVLDYAEPEMRDMTADFRILRDTDARDGRPGNGATVAWLPPRLYPNGTLSLEHIFPEAGNFVGVVTLDGPNGEHWVSRFPFSVGPRWPAPTPYSLIAAAAALALLLLVWGRETPPGG